MHTAIATVDLNSTSWMNYNKHDKASNLIKRARHRLLRLSCFHSANSFYLLFFLAPPEIIEHLHRHLWAHTIRMFCINMHALADLFVTTTIMYLRIVTSDCSEHWVKLQKTYRYTMYTTSDSNKLDITWLSSLFLL